MNQFNFVGRLASAPELTRHGQTTVCKFRLIQNRFAGKDDATGENKEKVVGINFTSFGSQAETISKHCLAGDQLIVSARVEDTNYERAGETVYGHNFVVEHFDFGAPGQQKRDQLARMP